MAVFLHYIVFVKSSLSGHTKGQEDPNLSDSCCYQGSSICWEAPGGAGKDLRGQGIEGDCVGPGLGV